MSLSIQAHLQQFVLDDDKVAARDAITDAEIDILYRTSTWDGKGAGTGNREDKVDGCRER